MRKWAAHLGCIMLLLLPQVGLAAVQFLPSSTSLEPVTLAYPAAAQEVYATLQGAPHSYRFTLTDPRAVPITVRLPLNELGNQRTRLLLVREKERGVEEVWRANPAKLDWRAIVSWAEGKRYWESASVAKELSAGTYRLEVSSPQNTGRYHLTVGVGRSTWEQWTTGWATQYAQHRFAGGAVLSIVFVPAILLPLLFVSVGIALLLRRRQATRSK